MRAFMFDEPGTGKTKRSIDIFKNQRHVLVVCPASVVKTSWLPQIKQWDPEAEAITIKEYKQRGGWRNTDEKYLVVSYNMLEKIQNLPEKFSMIVDESHYVKNHRTTRSLYVRNLGRYAENVLMLTGTPAPRDAEDLFGQVCVLYPDKHKRVEALSPAWKGLTSFRNTYGTPKTIWIRGRAMAKYEYSEVSVKLAADEISEFVLPRRTSIIEFPNPIWVAAEKNDMETEAIKTWKKTWMLDDKTYADDATIMAAKIGQLDDGFAYHSEDDDYELLSEEPSKIQALIQLQKTLGETLLVWVRYRVLPQLIKARYHSGEAVEVDKYMEMDDDEKYNVKIVIANPASAGTGVDGLQHDIRNQAWFDLPWTYAEYKQGVARLLRRGTEFDSHGIYLFDTPYQRGMWDVVNGRQTLDEVIKDECDERP